MRLPIELWSIITHYVKNPINLSCTCQTFNLVARRQFVNDTLINKVTRSKHKIWSSIILGKYRFRCSTKQLIKLIIIDSPELLYQMIIEYGVNPGSEDDYAIRKAGKYGCTDAVKSLLCDDRVNPRTYTNYAICAASACGRTEVVRLLLADKRVDPSDYRDFAIRVASAEGYVEIVRLLLADDRIDPGVLYNLACLFAKQKDVERGCEYLARSIKLEAKYLDLATEEADFDLIRNNNNFQRLFSPN